MKRYILILFLKDSDQVISLVKHLFPIESNTVTVEGDRDIISFKTAETLSVVKAKILSHYEHPPLFILIDADTQGKAFDMFFEKIEPILLLEAGVESLMEPQIADEDLTLDILLDLMSKNGFAALTDTQKALLKKFSEE